MADLPGGSNGRAANGGARTTTGPVPVTQSDRSNIRTPQMIMNERRQREAARRQEADAARAADEQRKNEEDQRRRSSAERRAQAVAGVAGATPTSEAGAPYRQAPSAPLRAGDGQYTQYPPLGTGVPRQPERSVSGPAGQGHHPASSQAHDTTTTQYGRPRASSQSQQQPRPAAASTSESRRPPPISHSRRPSATAGASAQAGPSTAAPPPPLAPAPAPASSSGQQRQSTTSTFPHAFERWETLSSHWEGLTSYWIRKLESNTEEVRREPLAQQMSRQITDLSAAGANLFHAVVELQRLRASSERKFQRWFYDHRQEQERAQEREAQLNHALKVEQDARAEAVANMERMAAEHKAATQTANEVKRELQISKEEARRAWEELGRREQEERDRTYSLREGQPTTVGGVQVVPMVQGMGRHGSMSHRGAHSGDETYGAGSSGGHGGIEQHYSYEDPQSSTDTDPFTEGARHGRRDPAAPPLSQGTYVPSGAAPPSSGRSAPSSQAQGQQQSVPAAPPPPQQRTANPQQAPAEPNSSRPEAFYQQPEAYLHGETATSIPEDERSYVTSQTSEADDDYATDAYGRYIHDDNGRRVTFGELRERDSDEYDVREDRRRELEHLQHYGSAATSPSGYATSSTAESSQPQSYATAGRPDYSGDDYGDEWGSMRHHHPTRLSDVMEEDELSRTSPSRASQASRRLY